MHVSKVPVASEIDSNRKKKKISVFMNYFVLIFWFASSAICTKNGNQMDDVCCMTEMPPWCLIGGSPQNGWACYWAHQTRLNWLQMHSVPLSTNRGMELVGIHLCGFDFFDSRSHETTPLVTNVFLLQMIDLCGTEAVIQSLFTEFIYVHVVPLCCAITCGGSQKIYCFSRLE